MWFFWSGSGPVGRRLRLRRIHFPDGEVFPHFVEALFAEAANGRKIFRRVLKHVLQFGLRFIEVVQLEQRAAERDARGQITRMGREAAAAGGHRLFKAARAPVFFGELRKRDRRRVFFDPASKLFYAWIVCHEITSSSHCA